MFDNFWMFRSRIKEVVSSGFFINIKFHFNTNVSDRPGLLMK